ncbi:dUTP diphosphatase [Sulfurimonas sp. HSL-1716]|uniref:dUTP diphosphatase n=1 Tax=Hydrocurvibacter sulfurireducens TaxID=3131937 RepID=UPI0031F9D232
MDKILMMLQLQQQLNDSTNGENWTEGITKNGKEINWKRCIYMECAEMIDSFSWKHWKNISQDPDWDNLKIEVVDVWHFIMSLAIEEYAKNMRGQLEDLAAQIAELPAYETVQRENSSFASQSEIIEKVELLMIDALSRKSPDISNMVNHFFELVTMSGLDITSLYRLYVGKNILNQFRQDHGYKEGSYIKIWNGSEDNVIMKRIWEENGDIKPELLYKKLKEVYDTLV